MARGSVEHRVAASRQHGSLTSAALKLMVAIALIAGLVLGALTWGPNLARHQIAAKVGELVGRELSIGRIEVSPFTGRITITDLVVMRPPSPKPTLVAKRLSAEISPLAYLRGRVVVRSSADTVTATTATYCFFGTANYDQSRTPYNTYVKICTPLTTGPDGSIYFGYTVEGDTKLFNQYGVIVVNPAKHPQTKTELAQKFADWVVSPSGQAAIAAYKISGETLFFPNAQK